MLREHRTMMVKTMANMTNGHTQVKMSVPFDTDLENDIEWAMSNTAPVAADRFVRGRSIASGGHMRWGILETTEHM